jgi:MerR HTH family regulatory protein/B12 binding domain
MVFACCLTRPGSLPLRACCRVHGSSILGKDHPFGESDSMPYQQGLPIRVVARRTGLTSHVIRVWEKRYGVVSPLRTPTNRRLYSDSDVERLQLLRRATLTVVLSQPFFIEQVIVPLMHRIGDLWHEGVLRVAHEHLASAVVRTSLGSPSRGYGAGPSAPNLVVATPTGQMHELGAMIVATTAASDGWCVTYLGPSLPAEEIAGAVHQRRACAVALSIIYPGG